MHTLLTLLAWYNAAVLAYFAVAVLIYFILLATSAHEVIRQGRAARHADLDELLVSPLTPAIAIIAPAYNEGAGIAQSVRSLLALRYPNHEVIVVNDGSCDDTLDILKREFALRPIDALYHASVPCRPVRGVYISPLEPALTVVDKENGGKADALNCGLNVARASLFCSIDADSLLEPDALLRVVRPFVDDPEGVAAVGGIVRIANDVSVERGSLTTIRLPSRALPMFQVIEYMRAFLAGRAGWSALNSLLIISGAFGLFRRDLVLDVGGYTVGCHGEDAELVTRMHRRLRELRRPYKMVFLSDPVCWTEAPETMRVLRRQRRRWHRGLGETLRLHRDMFLRPRYGSVGSLAYPYFFFIELLSPIVEATGYVTLPLACLLGALDPRMALALLGVALVYGLVLSIGALALEEYRHHRYPSWRDLVRLCAFTLAESFGYRQLTVLWRLEGLLDLLRHNDNWGVMERRGLGTR